MYLFWTFNFENCVNNWYIFSLCQPFSVFCFLPAAETLSSTLEAFPLFGYAISYEKQNDSPDFYLCMFANQWQ